MTRKNPRGATLAEQEPVQDQHQPALSLTGISKRFGDVVAVDEQTFSVGTGEVLSLLGPSGCGKSTTLRMIAGLETPSAGEVTIHGRTVTSEPPSARNVGLVPQDYGIFPHLTVWENVAFGLRMRKVAKQELTNRVGEALELVRMLHLRERRKNQLSGGQQQRVALARAIVIRPDVLLLDEPLGALDKQLRSRMQVELRRLQEQVAVTTVIVTHDQEEALVLSDRIAVMDDGRIRQIGTPNELYTRPGSRFVAEFMGAANFLPAVVDSVDGDRLTLGCNGVRFAAVGRGRHTGEQVVVSIRPERITMHLASSTDRERFTGTVTAVVYKGQFTEYAVDLAGVELVVAVGDGREAPTAPGSAVTLSWDPQDGVIFDDDKTGTSVPASTTSRK